MSSRPPRVPGEGAGPRRSRTTRPASGVAIALSPMLLLGALPACSPDAPMRAQPAGNGMTVPAMHDAKVRAHMDLAYRVRRFLIERGAPGQARGPVALDDERFRLGAFWRARTDTHHFGPDFQARARLALVAPGAAPEADAALRQLQATVDARLPDWQALVDYNTAGTMRDDGGEEGRRLLPWAIAAIDAIEVAAWAYVDAVPSSS